MSSYQSAGSFYREYKSTINTVALVAAGFIGWSIYQNNKKKKDEAQANAAGQLANAELAELAARGITPSYGNSQFEIFSEHLVQAMTGCGTDEDAIMSVFRSMKNEADIRKLVSTFGVRYYQPCAWTSPISYAIWQANDKAYGGGIAAWLSYDLSDSDIAGINSILRSAGINYQF